MQIVSTPNDRPKQDALADLIMRKAALKQQIGAQQKHISVSTKKLFSPISLAGFALSLVGNKVNMVDGITYGFKMFKTIKDLFKKK